MNAQELYQQSVDNFNKADEGGWLQLAHCLLHTVPADDNGCLTNQELAVVLRGLYRQCGISRSDKKLRRVLLLVPAD